MAYVISEVGFESPKRYDSLASVLRAVAKIVAKNERDGESNYILVFDADAPRNGQRTAIVSIHEEGRNSREHTAAVLARASEQMAREACMACDGTGDSGDWRSLNCERCGGSGKELR